MSAKDPRSWSDKSGGSGSPRPGKPDWRGKGKTPASPTAAAKRQRGWEKRPDQAYRRAKFWFRVKVAGWLLALGVAIVAFILWFIRPARTPFLAMAVTDYHSADELRTPGPVPPNAWSEEDLQRFERLGVPPDRQSASPPYDELITFSRAEVPRQETGLSLFDDLRKRLSDIKKGGGRNKNVVIVYLSMHGAVNQDGDPCLIPPGAPPYDSSKWLRLSEVLQYLLKDTSDELHKLVVLDCNRMDVNWRLGLLYNGFADRLEQVWGEVQDGVPNLIILNSTSPGQIGWTSPEQHQGSVFGYCLYRGLRGWADEDGDREVSLKELYGYLKTQVRVWVTEHRDDVQEPMLVSEGLDRLGDLSLIHVLRREALAELPEPDPTPEATWQSSRFWDAHEELWTAHEELERNRAYQLDPVGWERFQQKLLRWEQLALAGNGYRNEYRDECRQTEEELRDLKKKLSQKLDASSRSEELAAYSLPLARRLRKLPPDYRRQADRLLASWDPGARKFNPQPEQPCAYLPAAETCWKLAREGAGADGWAALIECVDRAPERFTADVVELHFLRMLHAHLDPTTRDANALQVKHALNARGLAEQAAAPQDERVHYWTWDLVRQADAKRRQAEDRLFVGSLEEAADGSPFGEDQYQDAIGLAGKVEEAYELRDRALSQIPYLAQWLFAEDASELDQTLRELIQLTHELGRQLDESLVGTPPPGDELSGSLKQTQDAVGQRLDTLNNEFHKRCDDLRISKTEVEETLRLISAVLAVPLATGENRKDLWWKYRSIANNLAKETDKLAQASGQDARQPAEGERVPPQDQPGAWRSLRRVTRWEVHPALAVLDRSQLADETTEPTVDEEPIPKLLPPADPEKWDEDTNRSNIAKQGEIVRQRLDSVRDYARKRLEETRAELKRGEDRSPVAMRVGLSRADRLIRASAPLMNMEPEPWPDPVRDPVHQLRKLDRHDLLLGHCFRTLEDFWGPKNPDDPSQESFFRIVAQDYLDSAARLIQDLHPKASRFRHENVDLSELLQSRAEAARAGIQPKVKDLSVDKEEEEGSTSLGISVTADGRLPAGEAALYLRAPDESSVPVSAAEESSAPAFPRLGAAVPDGNIQPPQPWVPNRDLVAQPGDWQAVALYRGHRYPRGFKVERSDAGLEIVFEPPTYEPPTITVKGQEVESSSVVFILDYSGSMWERKTYTQADGTSYERARYEEARDILTEILRTLARRGGYQVGLAMFGHRVGWRTETRTPVVWDPQTPLEDRLPENPQSRIPKTPEMKLPEPWDDVEWLLDPTRFTEQRRDQIRGQLEGLRPLGETPLYFTITQAVGKLRPGTRSGKGHVVVVTDGVNERSDETPGRAAQNARNLHDYVEAQKAIEDLGPDRIRLDIVGFHTTEEDFRDRLQRQGFQGKELEENLQRLLQRFEDLKKLAAQSGGSFFPAANPVDLLDALERSLQLRGYQVVNETSGDQSEKMELNKTWTSRQPTDPRFRVRVPYRVRIVGPKPAPEAEVELEGGEELVLDLTRDLTRLVHHRYDYETRPRTLPDQFKRIPDPRSPDDPDKGFWIAGRLPRWDRTGQEPVLNFYVSIQNANEEEFSPRPREAWVRIEPSRGEEPVAEGTCYHFFDMEFDSKTPVPVLVCRARRWPGPATDAKIELWCKFVKTPYDHPFTVGDLAAKGRFPLEGREIELEHQRGEPGAWYRVTVTERHQPGSTLEPLKVEMDHFPKRIERRFNRKMGKVQHVFYFEDASAPDIPTYHVTFTTAKSLQDGAVSLPQPLLIEIPK